MIEINQTYNGSPTLYHELGEQLAAQLNAKVIGRKIMQMPENLADGFFLQQK